MQIHRRDRNDAPWCTTFPLVHPRQKNDMKGNYGAFAFQIEILGCQVEKKSLLWQHQSFDHRCSFPWRHKSVFVVHHPKPSGIIDFQQECLFYPFPLWIFYLHRWKYSMLNTPLTQSSRNRGCSQRLDKEVNVSQIIKKTNHEEKLKQNRLLYTLQRKKSHTICISGAQSGE